MEETKKLTRKEKRLLKQNKNGNTANQEKLNFQLKTIEPLTRNQKEAFEGYASGKNLLLLGSAGSGKTFLSVYMAIKEIMNGSEEYNKIYICRSAEPSKNVGFLPGTLKEKAKVYEAPYQSIFSELFGRGDAYEYLKSKNVVEFITTSYIRGITLNDCIVIVDEFQDMCWNELNVISSRIGRNSKIIYSGDLKQTDLKFEKDRMGHRLFVNIIKTMPSVKCVYFTEEDIVRSGFCKEWIMKCNEYERKNDISLLNM